MKKKHLIIVGTIIISAIVILGLYQTFALSGDITKDTSGYYNVTVNDGTTVNVPANSSKTVYYKLTNTNKGIVKYGVGYSGSNITVKYYYDTQDPVTGTVDYGKSKFIKLYVQNTGSTATTATLSTILGYEKGGDLIVPTGYTLVNEKKALSSKEVLQRLGLSYSKETPNFSVTSEQEGTNGIYAAEDDLGTSYYFRGAVENNYVSFASSAWRIIRINGDGTIRIILDSMATYNTMLPTLATDDNIDNVMDNAYIGYMYGTAGSSTYESTHSNSTNSSIKNVINESTMLIVPACLEEKVKEITNNYTIVYPSCNYEIATLHFDTVPSYNIGKSFHLKEMNYVGYIVNIKNNKVYVMGDTDVIDEINAKLEHGGKIGLAGKMLNK